MPSSNVHPCRTLLWFKSDFISFLAAKYNLPRLSLPKHVIKEYVWNCFALKVMHDGH